MGEAFAELKRLELAEDQTLRLVAWQPVKEELRLLTQRLERLAELAGEIFEAVMRLVLCAESIVPQPQESATGHENNSDESKEPIDLACLNDR